MTLKKIEIEYLTSGKYISEHVPMIHQRRKIPSFVLFFGVNGTLFISDGGNEYAMSQNEYLLLAADREHVGIRQSPPGLSYYWCHFFINGEYRLFTDASGTEYIEFGAFKMPMYGTFPEPSKMHLLFHQLIDSSRTAGAHANFISGRFLEIMLAEIAEANTPLHDRKSSRLTENITEWIRLNAIQIGSTKEVAAHFGYNSEYLTTMVKKATGKSLKELIIDSRIEYAKEILCTTNRTVREIAYESGFTDEKYFLRVFKKQLDITPTEFRNTYAKQKMNDR